MATVTAKELIKRLKGEGWSLSEEGVESVLEGNNLNLQQATQEILNSDLKDVGFPCLAEDVLKGKKNSLQGPVVLQVTKMRNVSAPKAFEDSGGAPRMLLVSLTDGTSKLQGLELQNIKALSLKTAPGTKIRLSGKIPMSGGFLLLNANNITVIGGTVQELYEKWKLSLSVSKYSRSVRAADGSGPPLWVPFGKSIVRENVEVKHFKALKDPNDGKEKQDDEFESQRKQVVKELAKEGNLKVFGRGKQLLDATVQKVVNAGFSPEVAEWALRNNRNDPNKAIRELRAAASGQPPPDRYPRPQEEDNDGGWGGRSRGGRGSGRGRGGKGRGGRGGPDDSDDDFDPPPNMPRPSGPASLFDFLDNKMIKLNEEVNFTKPMDVRGPSYVNERSRGRGRGRGGYGRGGYSRGAANGSLSPPDLSTENWPAPGEEPTPATSNRSYLESKEMMEEREREENMGRPSRGYQGGQRQTNRSYGDRDMGRNQGGRGQAYGGREAYYGNPGYEGRGGQGYGREDGRSPSYGRQEQYYQDNRRGGRGTRGGGYRGAGGGYGDTSNYYQNEGSGGRGNRGGGYRSGNSGNYNSGYSQNNSGNNYDNYSSGGRGNTYNPRGRGGNWTGGRGQGGGGRGIRSTSEYSNKEMEMIREFQRSMAVSGHYQQGQQLPPRMTNQRL